MKSSIANQPMNHPILASMWVLFLTCAAPALAESATELGAQAAWEEICKMSTPLFLEPNPAGKARTPDQEAIFAKMLDRAAKAETFRTRYPDDQDGDNNTMTANDGCRTWKGALLPFIGRSM
jgi:hypothetical protein